MTCKRNFKNLVGIRAARRRAKMPRVMGAKEIENAVVDVTVSYPVFFGTGDPVPIEGRCGRWVSVQNFFSESDIVHNL